MRISGERGSGGRGGFTLIEMIVVVALMGVVALIAGDAIMLGFKVQREERLHDSMVYKLDDAIDRMRRDVWAARGIRATDARLDLDTSEGAFGWTMAEDGTLTRTVGAGGASAAARTWTDLPLFHFALAGPGRAAGVVRVTIDSKERGGRSDDVMMVSEVLAGGGQ